MPRSLTVESPSMGLPLPGRPETRELDPGNPGVLLATYSAMQRAINFASLDTSHSAARPASFLRAHDFSSEPVCCGSRGGERRAGVEPGVGRRSRCRKLIVRAPKSAQRAGHHASDCRAALGIVKARRCAPPALRAAAALTIPRRRHELGNCVMARQPRRVSARELDACVAQERRIAGAVRDACQLRVRAADRQRSRRRACARAGKRSTR